mmetsp:Transcript_16395/g.46927  ORF Transcript_16395/g.46927 Transcript_16395/m.46927 type:complete len:320 (-) Transcript_16395:1439-2398(-)
MDLLEHQGARDRGLDRLALRQRLLHLRRVRLLRVRELVQQRGEVDRGVAVLRLQPGGDLGQRDAWRAHQVQEATIEDALRLRVDGRLVLVRPIDGPELPDGAVVVRDLFLSRVRIGRGHVQDQRDGGHLLLEEHRLVGRGRVAGEQEAVGHAFFLDGPLQHLEDDRVGDRILLRHVHLDLHPEPRLRRDLLPEHLLHVQVDEVQLLGKLLAAGALAKNEHHIGRDLEVRVAHGVLLLGHVNVDDLLRLRRAVLRVAVRRQEGLLLGAVGVALHQPLLEPAHRGQALGSHLAKGEEPAGDHLLQGGVQGVVCGVHGGEGL